MAIRRRDSWMEENGMGIRLAQARMEKKMTQTEVARLVGVGRSTVCNIESGKVWPKVRTLMEMARVYEIGVDWILYGGEKQ